MVGDYLSKYFIVRKLPNSSTHAVIKELGLIFTELGRPFILRSDNGPCYTSREFHNFLSFYQVDHITSRPHYPQSNGFAEALVDITKKLMEKAVKDGKPWGYGLMQYRTTPISSILPSPLEMLTEEDLIPHFHNFHQLLDIMWKPPRYMRNCLGGSPALPQEPTWNWTLDNLSLSRKWVETLENCYCWPTSNWAQFILGEISRKFHIEKDQGNDQT